MCQHACQLIGAIFLHICTGKHATGTSEVLHLGWYAKQQRIAEATGRQVEYIRVERWFTESRWQLAWAASLALMHG